MVADIVSGQEWIPRLQALTLGWRPFLDPLSVHDSWWWFLIPMSFGIAVVYRAARLRDMERYWRSVCTMTLQIVVAMILLAAASYLFVMVYVRFIAMQPA